MYTKYTNVDRCVISKQHRMKESKTLSTAFNENFVIAEITICCVCVFFLFRFMLCSVRSSVSDGSTPAVHKNQQLRLIRSLNESTFHWSENMHLQMLPIVLLFIVELLGLSSSALVFVVLFLTLFHISVFFLSCYFFICLLTDFFLE